MLYVCLFFTFLGAVVLGFCAKSNYQDAVEAEYHAWKAQQRTTTRRSRNSFVPDDHLELWESLLLKFGLPIIITLLTALASASALTAIIVFLIALVGAGVAFFLCLFGRSPRYILGSIWLGSMFALLSWTSFAYIGQSKTIGFFLWGLIIAGVEILAFWFAGQYRCHSAGHRLTCRRRRRYSRPAPRRSAPRRRVAYAYGYDEYGDDPVEYDDYYDESADYYDD